MQTMTDVELLCEALELTCLEELNKQLAQVAQDKTQGREVLMKEVRESVNSISRIGGLLINYDFIVLQH